VSEIALPDSLGYTAEHEWIAVTPGSDAPSGPVRVGISAIAVEALGEIVYVELPEVGAAVTAGEPCGEIESTKSVSELFSPATGTIAEVNTALVDDAAIVGNDPYGEGWLFAVEVTALGDLLTADAYRAANSE